MSAVPATSVKPGVLSWPVAVVLSVAAGTCSTSTALLESNLWPVEPGPGTLAPMPDRHGEVPPRNHTKILAARS